MKYVVSQITGYADEEDRHATEAETLQNQHGSHQKGPKRGGFLSPSPEIHDIVDDNLAADFDGSDVDMANSIWRRFFLGKEDPDVEKIELLVKYVRKTVASLDQIKIEDLYSMEPGSALSWPDIKKLEIERTSQ